MVKYYINGELVENIRFPVTDVGAESVVTMLIENDHGENIELVPYVGDNEVSIVEYPRILHPGEKGKSVWIFTPNKEREKSLSTMCGFKEILGD